VNSQFGDRELCDERLTPVRSESNKNNEMEEDQQQNSPVISVQREGDTWVWTISTEDWLTHTMNVIQRSNRTYPTYEVAMTDAEVAMDTIPYS
jgi:hypothetical protein